MTRLLRPFCYVLLGLAVLVAAVGSWAWWQLDASLPMLDGRLPLAGLGAETGISRDARGTVTIKARDRMDAARALGFVHAQERFFQMDLLRRRAAGELSALVGAAAIDADKAVRLHQLRRRAGQIVELLPAPQRALLQAYVDGVNAGLAALAGKPFEYYLLGVEPSVWQPDDTVLAAYAMYLTLQASDGQTELTRALARERLPPALYAFLRAPGSSWDAPLFGEPLAPLPLPDTAALAGWQPVLSTPIWDAAQADVVFPGSNNWAVAGSLTTHGAAMVANDMHLGLQVPNIWFRTRLQYGVDRHGANTSEQDVVGVSLPGTPMMIVGSNGRVAWGFTNSYGDYNDVIRLEQSSPERYRTPDGEAAIETVQETIAVKDAEPVTLAIETTRWGPVIHSDADGVRYVFRWVAHDPEQAINFGLLQIEQADTVIEALKLAQQARVPSQNFVVADREGNIGWTIIGAIPRRVGYDGSEPVSFASGDQRWDGYRDAEEYPEVLNPAAGRIWTANARVVSGDALAVLGDGGYDFGARAGQIRDNLLARQTFAETDLLAVALDTRAPVLDHWQQHLLALLDEAAVEGEPQRAEFRALISNWQGRAEIASVDYRLVRGFRSLLRDALYRAWLHELYAVDPELKSGALSSHWEGIVWQVLQQQPAALLPQGYISWREFELAVLDALLDGLDADSKPLAERTWGEKNTAAIRHPLSRFLPVIGRWLDAPAEPLPGDANMVRVQGPAFGASERMIIAPGFEANALFHMPGGQSGHPLSPFYLSGHDDWVAGKPSPLLPGETQHLLTLQPTVTLN